MSVMGNGKYHPDMQDFLGSETKQLSLRQAAQADAFRHGPGAVFELQYKWHQRKYNRRRGVKTNVGDPNRTVMRQAKARGK